MVRVQLHASTSLPEQPLVPVKKRLGWPQSESRLLEKRKSLLVARNQIPNGVTHQLVTIPNMQTRLRPAAGTFPNVCYCYILQLTDEQRQFLIYVHAFNQH